ncbi:WD40 repeat-like protein [Mollisia scopiformis]|uniref:WD40 repeat-like protein n=1 Tax=Mollisia scopiformis TaxID=149040 RepID=A0A132B8A9_MOLSC|nr:WD40 repeat-like protein [Mollisia scopiformis]KUJ08635.1 WD40 repeat-like protein [Mollisia scopiformis]
MATNAIEDSLVRDYQWVHQSGDATTITWTGETTFVSGALAHYDVHNMQYNRHGNLVVGSTANKVVKMIDGHRALRPIVTAAENKENSLPAMRATQDEWRYAPVVSSAYCDVNGYTFTASFDKTVKIWRVLEKGPSMQLKGIWLHDFGVNFVLTSKHHDMVATASEAHNDAVRVYKFDETDVSRSAYDVYNADRALTRPGDLRMADKWAYHPATMQWGRSDKVSNLLLVGYSPRGTSNDEAEIPESKRNSGELCCWNAKTGQQVLINAGKSANVFEVIWHPSQPIFLVATAPSGTFDSRKTRTQVRLFQLVGSDIESFQCVKTLDCPASDVNELTMMPTSLHDGYVTASCTDGKTYVWDTMHDDRLLHVLPHGDSIDNPDHEIPLEQADTGVKFAAWGRSSNRLYTGSSDGVVKAWDITRPTADALVRDVLRAASGISCGIFSADFSKLLIGDGAGHLHLIQAADDESDDRDPLFLPLTRRKFMVPHPDPFSDREILENREEYRRYMEQGILIKLPMDVPGWGAHYRVGKGPNYDLCGLYRSDAHEDGDNTKPLLPKIGNTTNWDGVTKVRPQVGNFPVLLPAESSRKRQHNRLEDLDLDVNKLLASTKSKDLKQDLAISAEYMLNFEEEGRDYVLDK